MTDQELALVAFTSDLHYAVYEMAKDAAVDVDNVHDWYQSLTGAVREGLREAVCEHAYEAIS